MSSSSSTNCDCFYCQYGIGYACNDYDYDAYAFYPTLGQPCVYYAQVPPPPQDQTDRRKHPNFFMRAFRWYTEEHVSQAEAQNMEPAQVQNMAPTQAENRAPQNTATPAQGQCTETTPSSGADPDVEGFANWLDAKYEQYLREGHVYEYQCMVFTQTSEGMGVQPQCQSQPGRNKRFTKLRLHSPWKKRRGCSCTNNASEGGDFPIDANKSVVFLLEPKDLPRPISECCPVSSTPCCSVATVVKKLACSRSATNTITRSEVAHIDPVAVQEGITPDKPQQLTEHGCKQTIHQKADSANILLNDTSNIGKHKSRNTSETESLFKVKKNVSCECSNLPSPKPVVETGTQYDTVVKLACECFSKQTCNNAVACCPAPIDPAPTAPAAVAEAKYKKTWFQKNLSKISSSKTFSLKPQNDVECQCEPTPKVDESQCEPTPKVDESQYCTQCGCRCMEMRDKLLCCDCMRTTCGKETPAQMLLKLQMTQSPPPVPMQEAYARMPHMPPPPVQQQHASDMPPIPPPTRIQQEYAPKPYYMPPPPVQQQNASDMPPIPPPTRIQQEYAPKPYYMPPPSVQQQLASDMPPIPPPTQIQQEYAPKLYMPPPPVQEHAPKLDMPPILPPKPSQQEFAPRPQFVCKMSVVNEPQSPAPVNSEPYAMEGRPLCRTSFPCTICNSAQTSDHAIDLDQATIRGHPLFLTIVCNDRFNQDCLCRQ